MTSLEASRRSAGAWPETDIGFGEQGGQLPYGSYLQLATLLDAQSPVSDPPVHDELLFITVHQVSELWFQLLLHEVEAARDAIFAREAWWARQLLSRVHAIGRVLVEQIDVLETMTPQDFRQLRHKVAPASGFQSVQFRELEFLSGAKDEAFIGRFRGLTEEETARLERRLDEPTLWDAFADYVRARGLGTSTREELLASLHRAAHDRGGYDDVWELAEALLRHDESAAAWRCRHLIMVERMLGTMTGSDAAVGVEYLRNRRDQRYYPLLWELRSQL